MISEIMSIIYMSSIINVRIQRFWCVFGVSRYVIGD